MAESNQLEILMLQESLIFNFPYITLGLDPARKSSLKEAEINRAYRRAMKRWHPDHNVKPEDHEHIAFLQNAKEFCIMFSTRPFRFWYKRYRLKVIAAMKNPASTGRRVIISVTALLLCPLILSIAMVFWLIKALISYVAIPICALYSSLSHRTCDRFGDGKAPLALRMSESEQPEPSPSLNLQSLKRSPQSDAIQRTLFRTSVDPESDRLTEGGHSLYRKPSAS